MIRLEKARPDDSAVVDLGHMLQSEYVGMYGEPDPNPDGGLDDAIPAFGGVVLVVWESGLTSDTIWEPVSMGGFVRREGMACLRRMYTRYDVRGRGHAAMVLDRLELIAQKMDHTRMALETGDVQTAALSLYRANGYTEIKPFGYYKDQDTSVFLGKDLRP